MPRNQKRSKPVHRPTSLSSPSVSFLTISLIALGILLVAASFSWQFYKTRVLSFSTNEAPQAVVEQSSAAIPHLLTIPDIGVSLSVTSAEIKNGVWETSDTGASYLISSAALGTPGNIIMYGHNKTNLLGNLKKVAVGQTIYVTATDGSVHNYTIQEIQTVAPSQTEVIQQTTSEILTLYTCTGFLDSKRLVVKATPQD